jgi:hypothetical protein
MPARVWRKYYITTFCFWLPDDSEFNCFYLDDVFALAALFPFKFPCRSRAHRAHSSRQKQPMGRHDAQSLHITPYHSSRRQPPALSRCEEAKCGMFRVPRCTVYAGRITGATGRRRC